MQAARYACECYDPKRQVPVKSFDGPIPVEGLFDACADNADRDRNVRL